MVLQFYLWPGQCKPLVWISHLTLVPTVGQYTKTGARTREWALAFPTASDQSLNLGSALFPQALGCSFKDVWSHELSHRSTRYYGANTPIKCNQRHNILSGLCQESVGHVQIEVVKFQRSPHFHSAAGLKPLLTLALLKGGERTGGTNAWHLEVLPVFVLLFVWAYSWQLHTRKFPLEKLIEEYEFDQTFTLFAWSSQSHWTVKKKDRLPPKLNELFYKEGIVQVVQGWPLN